MYQFSEAQSCLIDYSSVGWPGLTDTGMLWQRASECAEFPQQLNKLQLIYLFLKNVLIPKEKKTFAQLWKQKKQTTDVPSRFQPSLHCETFLTVTHQRRLIHAGLDSGSSESF